MGNFILNSILKNYDFYHMDSAWEDWQLITEKDSLRSSKTVKNKNNLSILGELHQSLHVENLQKCLKILQFRKTYQQSSIVGIHGVYLPNSEEKITFNFCGQIQNYSLLTEHMSFCFSDIGLIQFSNGIYVLKNVLSGAKLIREKLNITTLYDQNMIFFDNQNRCKVWINENIIQNKLLHDFQVSQEQSILSIFAAVQMKIIHSEDFQRYLQMKSSFELKSFIQAINFVHNFQSSALKLKNLQDHTFQDASCKDWGKISQIRTQKPKKSLSARKKSSKVDKNNKCTSTKNLHYNSNIDLNFSVILAKLQNLPSQKLKQNIPQSMRSQHNNYLSNKLGVKSFLKLDTLKKQQPKKQKINKNQLKNKFSDFRSADHGIPKKSLSSKSTDQQSSETQQSYEKYIDNQINYQNQVKFQIKQKILSPRVSKMKTDDTKLGPLTNFNKNLSQFSVKNIILQTKQTKNCGQNFNKFQNMKGNEKLSLNEYYSRIKNKIFFPFYQNDVDSFRT